ncbi:polyketide synthase [Kitasatospora indigofera]|uniref:Polyketide synthase n=1 Tax=Kitasatospora indigofera TaxID=67307 RepID=A0A919G6N2_9ACTN|nr:PhlD [Kitasatospora indigofera]GHH79082.1 polyketide synthase [Kitasatospora indigofera]
MSAYVSRPALVLGEHVVDAARIRDDILTWNPNHPKLEVARKALTNLPGTRRYLRPYEEITAERTTAQRKDDVFDTILQAARHAARAAMDHAGVTPDDIDCIITTSSSGDRMPGLDVHLQNTLPLRPGIRRRPMTQLACAGGSQALIIAEEHLARYPEHKILVVAGEFLSSLYQQSLLSIEDLIYKALWGDLVAATVVCARPLGPGASLRIDHTLEYVIPHTTDRYRKETDERGDRFSSTRGSLRSVTDLAPVLMDWLDKNTDGPLDFGILHPGGPAILAKLATALDVDEQFTRHSRDVLAEEGNLGGPTIFSVLERTYRTPPTDGACGLVFGLGPGVAMGALLVTWTEPQA